MKTFVWRLICMSTDEQNIAACQNEYVAFDPSNFLFDYIGWLDGFS